jgi:hypothetical protein
MRIFGGTVVTAGGARSATACTLRRAIQAELDGAVHRVFLGGREVGSP